MNFYIYFTLIFFFFCSFISAQEGIGKSVSPPTLVLKQGAAIFSADASFNNQINSDKITVKNADISDIGAQSAAKVLTAKSERIDEVKAPKNDFKSDLKKAEVNKKKEALKNVKKEIVEHNNEAKKNSFNSKNLRGVSSSGHFAASTSINKDYVTPSYNHHHLSKIFALQNLNVVNWALDFLHKQKYAYYNNKSLDYCFSEVFSVRPPPTII